MFGNERYKRQVPGPFDCGGKHPLMFCAVAGNPAGHYFAALCHKMTQLFVILVVDLLGFFQAEFAVLAMEHPALFWIAGVFFGLSF